MAENAPVEIRTLALTPTWSVATVLTIFVVVSMQVERSIHRLSSWLKKTHRRPLLAAVEKMKEELMLLGFISLLLTATSPFIAELCIPSRFYESSLSPCTRSQIEEMENGSSNGRKLLRRFISSRRIANEMRQSTCKEGEEPFVTYSALEQLHRFIFVMAVTHVTYSCLTMLLAIVKIHSWREWETEARMDHDDTLPEITRDQIMKRQSSFLKYSVSSPFLGKGILILMCFFRQFGRSVVRIDYLTLRKGFILNHHLSPKYDFHSYMVRSMEEEFQRIVGVSGPLWGFVVAFMLFNIKGSNLYFWIAITPTALVLLVGAKLQLVIATLSTENAASRGYVPNLNPRDELFWFKKPELLLSLIHFILFQNAFELASFLWFWWQFGYDSCFLRSHFLVYIRLFVGFAGQFLCSYSTLPLYALVTQMGTNYKAALIPERIRETIHGWKKAARRRRRMKGEDEDDRTVHTVDEDEDDRTVHTVDEDEDDRTVHTVEDDDLTIDVLADIENDVAGDDKCCEGDVPLLRSSLSLSRASATPLHDLPRSSSMPLQTNGNL